MGHVQIQANIGIEVRTIENGDLPVERHPQRETKAVECVPRPYHERAIPTARLETLRDRLERGLKHTAGKSFGMANELLAHFLSLDLQTAKVPPS